MCHRHILLVTVLLWILVLSLVLALSPALKL